MITFSTYRKILKNWAAAGYHARTVASLQTDPTTQDCVFLKHDIEARLDRALTMAKIEAEEGHKATYYFQADLLNTPESHAIVKQIAALGHEATYHYDVLDAANGDYGAAQAEFAQVLSLFEDMECPVKTVCPHGNPTRIRDGWKSNKDFFKSADIRARYPDMIDIVVDFPTLFPEGIYISDAGYALRIIGQIATNDTSNDNAMSDGTHVAWDDIPALAGAHNGVVVSVHSHRFKSSALALYGQRYGFAALKRGYMTLRHVPGVAQLANRFYKYTRRF